MEIHTYIWILNSILDASWTTVRQYVTELEREGVNIFGKANYVLNFIHKVLYCLRYSTPWYVPDSLSTFLCPSRVQSQGECDWFADPLHAGMQELQMTDCNFGELQRICSSALTALAWKFSYSSPVSAFRCSLSPTHILGLDTSSWTCSVHSSLFRGTWCSCGGFRSCCCSVNTVTCLGSISSIASHWRPVVGVRNDGSV